MYTENMLLELMLKNGLTIEKTAQQLKTFQQKCFKKDLTKIRYTDVEQILDIIGYEIKITKDNYLK